MNTANKTSILGTNYGTDVLELVSLAMDKVASGDLLSARAILGQLSQLQMTDTQKMMQENLQREVNQKLAERIHLLEEQIRAQIQEGGQGDAILTSLGSPMEELNRLDPQNPALPGWNAHFSEIQRRAFTEKKIAEIEAELERRWREAEEQEAKGLYGAGLVARYADAAIYIRGQANSFDHPDLPRLVQSAEDRHRKIRSTHEIASTRQQLGEFRALLEMLEQMKPEETVTISPHPFAPEPNVRAELKKLSVKEARPLVEKQASEYATQKATEYREEAERYLQEHNPKAAKERLDLALKLYSLHSEQITMTQAMLRDRVQPALERREKAERILQESRQIGNPRSRWAKLDEAAKTDSYLPELENERSIVAPAMQKYFAEQFDVIEEMLRASPPNVLRIKTELQPLLELAEQYFQFAEQAERASKLMRENENWAQLEREIQQAIQEADKLARTNPGQALDGFQMRLGGWGKRAERYQLVSLCLTRLQVQVNSRVLQDRLELALHSVDLRTVEQAITECKEAIVSSPGNLGEFSRLQKRLEIHRDFLRGLRLLRKVRRTLDEEEQAIELLQVVVDQNGDDQDEARVLIDENRSSREGVEKRKQTLAQAEVLFREKRFAEAFRNLYPYRQDSAAAELFNRVAKAWEETLIQDIVKKSSQKPINEDDVKKLVADLERVGSSSTPELKQMVYSRCAEQRAYKLEEQQLPDWLAIVSAWQEALEYAPANLTYQAHERNADKQRRYFDLQSLEDRDARLRELRQLVQKYPGDLDVRLWYLKALLDKVRIETDYTKVEDEAQNVDDAINHIHQLMTNLNADAATRKQVENIQEEVSNLRMIARRKHLVEMALKPDKLLEAWQRARKDAEDLVNANGNDRRLRDWWDRLRDRSFREAQTRLQEKQGQGIWYEIQPAAQMLALDPDNATSREVIQKVYRAIVDLPGELGDLEKDTIGASYEGEASEKLQHQIAKAVEVRQHLYLGREILGSFGGLFDNASQLRGEVNTYINRITTLTSKLEDVRRFINQGYAAIEQAKSNEQFWHAYDDAQKKIVDQGYGQHMTFIELEKHRKEVREKQTHLRALRENLVQSIQVGQTEDALRFAEQMMGMPAARILDGRSNSATVVIDRLADPKDEYGEQSRIQIQEPFTKRRLTSLHGIVQLLTEQVAQIKKLQEWLPSYPTQGGERINIPIVVWDMLVAAVDLSVRSAEFDEARQLIDKHIYGDNGEYVGEFLALLPALNRLGKPPVLEHELVSQQARQLWTHSQKLRQSILGQRNEAIRKQQEVDQVEVQWNDTYNRFRSEYDRLGELRPRWLGFGTNKNYDIVRRQARDAFNRCMSLCPDYPGLSDYGDGLS